MRVLGRLRISRDTEASTAIERQREAITRWAELHRHEIIGWAEDRDLSGSVDPFEAPSLGPWLNERTAEWDILVAWKLDRLGRGLFDLNDLFRWSIEHGKPVACVEDNIDLSTSVGRLIATILAGVAEMEREAIRTRIRDQREASRRTGAYTGGSGYPYGYRPVKRNGQGWELELDPAAVKVVRDIFGKVCDRSARSICADLNRDGVPAPRGGRWNASTITTMVRSRAALGYVEHDGKLVIGEDGQPVRRPALVTQEAWDRANDAIGRPGVRQAKKVYDTSLLSGLAVCDRCEAPMHSFRQVTSGKLYEYYRCSGNTGGDGRSPCAARSIRMEAADETAVSALLDRVGEIELYDKIRVTHDNALRVAELTAQITDLTDRMAESDDDEDDHLTELSRLRKERKSLRSEAPTERWEYRPTGETWRQAWDRSDIDGRRALLHRRDVVFRAVAGEKRGTAIMIPYVLIGETYQDLSTMR
jgi:site-specific DNA recombinase